MQESDTRTSFRIFSSVNKRKCAQSRHKCSERCPKGPEAGALKMKYTGRLTVKLSFPHPCPCLTACVAFVLREQNLCVLPLKKTLLGESGHLGGGVCLPRRSSDFLSQLASLNAQHICA